MILSNRCRPAVWAVSFALFSLIFPGDLYAADKIVGIHSARVMSQSFPWIAQEAGLFKKYNLDFNLVFVA